MARAGRSRVPLFVLLAAALAAVPASASGSSASAGRSFAIPSSMGRYLSVARKSGAPVLLPSSMQFDESRVYPSGGSHAGGYDLMLGAAANCGGADACFIADFSGERNHGTPLTGQRVTLRQGIAGGFTPLQCGASCSPPQISWIMRGVLYDIQARVLSPAGDRAALIAAANSAIAAGPR